MDYLQIYRQHAADYDRLVNAEDCDGQLLPAIERLCSLKGAAVLEAGAGTGRISRQMLARGARLIGIDLSPAMLGVARTHVAGLSSSEWILLQADGRQLPVASRWADLAIAGWLFGHLRSWASDHWQAAIGQALNEMERATKSGGTIIIIETLGTGYTEPFEPKGLDEYYKWLETARGFERTVLRTDYCFPDIEQAAQTTGFFFGSEFADRVRRESWVRVPECTGLWSKHV
jgi:ubiquinone/menaquinone biosynthesis C-methylase UbiE